MTPGKPVRPFLYPLIIVICLSISIGLLYLNFSNFIIPYAIVIGLLILCAVISLAGLIGFIRQPLPGNHISAKMGRLLLLIVLTIIVIVLAAIPVLIIQNA